MMKLENPTFQTLADEFLRLHRSPNRCSVEQFAADFPEMASTILSEFPALVLAEQLKSPREENPDTIEVPEQIGRYHVKGLIGRGGMGFVFSAKHPELDTDVAIKVLSFESLKSTSALTRFHLEARACAKMDHPNIVPVFDHGTADRFAYLVMRRIRGVSLDRIVEGLGREKKSNDSDRLNLDWYFIANIGSQVSNALAYAHAQGIIHRDIKPGNLMLEPDGKVWVTDFGLAKLIQSDHAVSQTGDIVGTPKYMAPEQLRGIYNECSDIYSLGVSLYELAAGDAVWQTATINDLLRRRHSLDLPNLKELNPAIPTALCDIIMKACSTLPENRYQTASELSHVLNRFAHGNAVADRRRTANSSRSKWRRKTIIFSQLAALFACCSITIAAVTYYKRNENPYQDPEAALRVLDDENVRERFVQELPNLIEKMADSDKPAHRSVLASLTKDAIQSTIDRYEIDPEDKKKLERNLENWIGVYKEGEMTSIQFGNIIHSVASSPAGSVLRLQEIDVFLSNSTLSQEEIKQARKLLLRLHWGVCNKIIKNAAMGQIYDELERLSAYTVGLPMKDRRVPDDELQKLLVIIETVVDDANIPWDVRNLRPADDIEATVEEALNTKVLDPSLLPVQHGRSPLLLD